MIAALKNCQKNKDRDPEPEGSFRVAPFFKFLDRKWLQTGPHLALKKRPFSNMVFDLDPRATRASIWVHFGVHFGCFFDAFWDAKKAAKKGCRNALHFCKKR